MAQYTDLIPGIFPIEGVDIDDGDTYRSAKFNVGEKRVLGVTIKASQSLSVKVAWGRASDTAAAAGTASSASLPYATDAQTFASSSGATEAGTYKEFTIPPMAEQAQLVIANSSGSNVSDAFVDAALRVVSGASGSGGTATTNAGDLTSGTLDAARLPGVLQNVDTQAELQAAVGDVEATVESMASVATETKTVDTTSGGVSLKTSGAGLRGILLTNNGAVDCYISFDGTAVSGATAASHGGHLLPASGGEIYLDSPGALVIKGITASGSTVVAVSLFD